MKFEWRIASDEFGFLSGEFEIEKPMSRELIDCAVQRSFEEAALTVQSAGGGKA